MALVLIFSSGMILSGLIIWYFGRGVERQENQVKIQSLEAKLQLAQGRSNQLNEQLSRLQNDLGVVNQYLEKERQEKTSLVQSYAEPLRKFNLVLIVLGVTFGLIFGSMMAASYTEKIYMRKITQVEVDRAVYETRMRDFQVSMEKLESTVEGLQKDLQLEMEARIIAQTKLEIFQQGEPGNLKETKSSFFGFGKSRHGNNAESKESPALIAIPMSSPK
ncbi:MAG: hypothetical protein EXS63_06860 [Candidatus Omnitrophica bacterium]|nr:hypothetical protein [Candidatus Omnitrophota bacterium]